MNEPDLITQGLLELAASEANAPSFGAPVTLLIFRPTCATTDEQAARFDFAATLNEMIRARSVRR